MKVLMKAKAVAILTAFLMVFAMMPLTAFGEETSAIRENLRV